MAESISPDHARKLVLLSQRLPPAKQVGSAVAATLTAIEHLGYIQIDTISVIERAHHHTLWNRNPRYQATQLNQLIAQKQVFEYWSHAAAYLPMCDYRFSLPRKHAIARGDQDHWYARDKQLMRSVLKRIATEGPLMAKDFENTGKKTAEWESKPAKRALEYLFMQGDLMTVQRINFHKVYELTERVLPEGLNTSLPSQEEHARFLIRRYLRANGLGQAAEISYLLKKTKPLIATTLQEMTMGGELIQVSTGGNDYYALPSALELLSKPLSRSRLKILSPFDNLLIQRKRMQALFGFNYQIECYVPKAKRKHGYFSLPILWNGKLMARMDCKAQRHESQLDIYDLAVEPSLVATAEFCEALNKELIAFMRFNQCSRYRLQRASTPQIKTLLAATKRSAQD